MKKVVLVGLAVGFVSFAHADVLFNTLNNTGNYYTLSDFDGGIEDLRFNYGDQLGQVITNTNDFAITDIEEIFHNVHPTSGATAVLAEVFRYQNGTIGSLLDAQTTSFTEVDTTTTFGEWAGNPQYDISASVDLTGLAAGQQYLVVLQPQTPEDIGTSMFTTGGTGVYTRAYSSFGYPGFDENGTDWNVVSSAGSPGELQMEVIGAPAPEPATMALLGLGVVGLIRKRRR